MGFMETNRGSIARLTPSVIYSSIGLCAVVVYMLLPPSLKYVVYSMFPVAAAMAALYRSRIERDSARLWLTVAAFLGLFALADAAYWVNPSFPGPADALYLAGYVVAIGSTIYLRDPRSSKRRAYALRAMDAAIVSLCVGAVVWLMWVDPARREEGISSAEMVSLSYPILDLVLLGLVVSGGRIRGARAWFASALACFIVADLWYSIGAPQSLYAAGVWADAGWLSGYVLWGAAAFRGLSKTEVPDAVPKPALRIFYTATVLGTLGIFMFHAVTTEHIHVVGIAVLAVALSILAGMRLEATHRHLEEMVWAATLQNATLEIAMQHTEELRRSNQMILDSVAEGIVGIDVTGVGTFANRSASVMLGYAMEELTGVVVHDLIHDRYQDGLPRRQDDCLVKTAVETGEKQEGLRDVYWRKDGSSFKVDYTANPVIEEGHVAGAVVTFRDVSEVMSLEEQVRRSQRLEAMGRLAGGIAHDFNNLLAVIGNYAEFLEEDLPAELPQREDVSVIQQAVGKGVGMVRQLLAFSRRDVTEPNAVGIEGALRDIDKLLGPTLGEDISIVVECAPDLWDVFIDAGHFEQVVMNLTVNARDAMPGGGSITFQAANSIAEGLEMVTLTVADNGEGMLPETLEHVFEPFFTTKPDGKGNGLGLATSYGIVTQAGGSLTVSSELGIGTTFEISLPRCVDGATAEREPPNNPAVALGRGELILLIEDEEGVRASVARSLERAGYRVEGCAEGQRAIELVVGGLAPEIIVSDVVMPDLSGPATVERLRELGLLTPVVFMSGYSDEALEQRGAFDGASIIQKPFDRSVLLSLIQKELAEAPISASAGRQT